MRKLNKKAVILSAELSDRSEQYNKKSTDMLESYLKKYDLPYKYLVGCYKGHREASFLVETDSIGQMIDIAETFAQESIMTLDEDRNAKLVYIKYGDNYNTIESEEIGKLKAITNNEAIKLGTWSFCPLHKQFYGVL